MALNMTILHCIYRVQWSMGDHDIIEIANESGTWTLYNMTEIAILPECVIRTF